jgi:diguanylate cyclase (GGDEF)-like protein
VASYGYLPVYPWISEKVLPLTGLWTIVAYSQLICLVVNKRVVKWLFAGYGLVIAITTLSFLGHISLPTLLPGSAENSPLLTSGSYIYMAGVISFSALTLVFLFRSYRSSSDANNRNELLYLMIGAVLVGIVSVRIAIPNLPGYAIEHVTLLANTLLIMYIFNKQTLPDFKFVAKRCLTYISGSILIATLYFTVIWGIQKLSGGWLTPLSVSTLVGLVFVFPWLLFTLRPHLELLVDRIIYRERLLYRRKVLDFSKNVTGVLSITELADGMLEAIPQAFNASRVSLLLPSNGEFVSQFGNNLIGFKNFDPIKLGNDGPIIAWLKKNDRPLTREIMETSSEFAALRGEEKEVIRTMDVCLLVPMHTRGELVGILAVGKKRLGTHYSVDDITLLSRVADESAVAIKNAQLYFTTSEKVYTDELTGLLNHGHFHQRIDEEILRCCRFGSIFSVLFLDIDLFKTYNDTFGHLAGDEILRQVAECIRGSIRAIDVPFRYGGDEFAVILPEASLDDALTVGERIRKNIQSVMDNKGIALTCSIGISSWPTDGIGRESVINAADKALYWSKQKGRNQVSLTSELNIDSREFIDIDGEHEILSTIQALAATVDAKDPNTFGHSQKTSEYSVYVTKALGYTNDKIAILRAAALLHDIGKLRVSDGILRKPGPLDDEEWNVMRDHPRFGVAILKPIKALGICLPVIQHHHERYNGSGYPAGLRFDDIPMDARILAVADAYDAMTSERPYRKNKMSHQQAIDELARYAGTHFDPDIVHIFDELWHPLDSYVAGSGIARVTKRFTAVSTGAVTEIRELVQLQNEIK